MEGPAAVLTQESLRCLTIVLIHGETRTEEGLPWSNRGKGTCKLQCSRQLHPGSPRHWEESRAGPRSRLTPSPSSMFLEEAGRCCLLWKLSC